MVFLVICFILIKSVWKSQANMYMSLENNNITSINPLINCIICNFAQMTAHMHPDKTF